MTLQASENIRFGEFNVDRAGRRLIRDGKRVSIGPLEFKLLETLLIARGRVLTPDELRIAVWASDPNSTIVPAQDANALYVAVRKLRSALLDHGKYVVNIPKVGYTISEDAVVDEISESPDIQPVSFFVGRENEIAQIMALLTTTRMVTITGPPGVGKSGLAREVSRRQLGSHPASVHLIDLSSIDSGRFVAKAISSALGIPDNPGKDILKELEFYFENKAATLVLDNCEHLVEDVSETVFRLQNSTSRLTVLCTSRELLQIPGETVFSLSPLPVPRPRVNHSLDEMLQFDSVRLFVQLAERRRPDFHLTERDAMSIGEICRSLEGLPIAIELAASQVDAYTVQQIVVEVADRFRLLRRRSIGENWRNRTLEGAIDWSYGILTANEQRLLRRLSVFSGGWSADIAAAVCVDELLSESEIVHLLAGLVRRSLVQLGWKNGIQRYSMLEIIRQFARQQLGESGEESQFIQRRTSVFVELVERSFEEGNRGDWPVILECEYHNIRAVMEHTITAGNDNLSGLRLCGALNRFWYYHGHINEALHWTELALSKDDGTKKDARARALMAAGFFFGQLPGATDDAAKRRAYFEESISIWREMSDKKNLGIALIGYSFMLNRVGEYDKAINAAEESLETFRGTEFHFNAARAANNLALTLLDIGQFESARPRFEEALEEARISDDTFLVAVCLHNLADLSIQTGHVEPADELLKQSLDLFQSLGQRPLVARTVLLQGEALCMKGQFQGAVSLQQKALESMEELSDNQGIASALEAMGTTHIVARADEELAVKLIFAAKRLRNEINIKLGPARQAASAAALRKARKSLGNDAFQKASESGERITLKMAIALAHATARIE